MAAMMKLSMVMFTVMMVASFQMQTSVAQTRHVVGDALGWTIPPNGAAAYTTWAAQQNFTVGDTLLFNFTTGMHNVAEVSQAAYGPCTTTNPISIAVTGPATLTLSAPGTHYYVCTVGTHCQIGQKLTINVAPATAAAPAPATPPPAAAPTTPPPAATPTQTPSPSPVSPPTTSPTPAPAPGPSTTTPPTSAPAPSPVGTSPPSPPTSGPSPSGSTTPSPAGDTTPTPPSPSNAASLIAAVPATFLAVALAFFY